MAARVLLLNSNCSMANPLHVRGSAPAFKNNFSNKRIKDEEELINAPA